MRLHDFRLLFYQLRGELPCVFQQFQILLQIGKAQHHRAALAHAQKVARAADFQILPRDFKAVGVFVNHFEPLFAHLPQGFSKQQHAGAGCCATPHAPAQLVQLRQPHALGVFNHHQAGVGHVHAHFYHGGRHQHVQAA